MENPSVLRLVVGQLASNCYIVWDTGSMEGIVIDPGDDAEYISDTLVRNRITPTLILATHGHFDHILAAFALQSAHDIPFVIHESDRFLVDRMADTASHFLKLPHIDPPPVINRTLIDGQSVPIGMFHMSVRHTPGHTPGSVSLYLPDRESVFVGDTIFAGGAVGRTDHRYSSASDLRSSIVRILSYPDATRLLPGHGEESAVGLEKPFHGV